MTATAIQHHIPANNAARITSNDVLLLVATGYQTLESHKDLQKQAVAAIKKLRKAGKKVIVLVDASRVEGQAGNVETAALQGINSLDYDIMAMYGLPDDVRAIIDNDAKKHNNQNRVRAFSDQRSATSWLACHVIHRDGVVDGKSPAVCDLFPAK